MQQHKLKVRRPIPANRSYESVLHHFEIERTFARKLMTADREARKVPGVLDANVNLALERADLQCEPTLGTLTAKRGQFARQLDQLLV